MAAKSLNILHGLGISEAQKWQKMKDKTIAAGLSRGPYFRSTKRVVCGGAEVYADHFSAAGCIHLWSFLYFCGRLRGHPLLVI
jgi:hypothetical protein